MPSLDIVSEIDPQEIDNAVNNTLRAVTQRYDFREVETEVVYDKKESVIRMTTGDRMKIDALKEMFQSAAAKRKLDLRGFDFQEPEPGPRGAVKRTVKVRAGLDRDLAKKIVKMIKDTKLKVQASIQGEEVRLNGKKIDDLRAVMAMLQDADLPAPLQFVNMKS